MDFMQRIKSFQPELTKTQAKIADYILANPDSVCFLSLNKLAEEIGVTELTILNFCKKTGFDSFVRLKNELFQYLQERIFWNNKLETSSEQYDEDDSMFADLQKNQRDLIEATFDNLHNGELRQFVATLSEADHIYICGHEASFLIAANLQHKLSNGSANASLIDVSNYSDVLDMLSCAGERDVFVLITMPFYSAQTVVISDYLGSIGATVLAMTDKISSPIVKNARHVLLCNSTNLVFHNSIASMTAVSDVVASLYFLHNKERFRAYNEKVKAIEKFFKSSEIPAYHNEYFFNSDAAATREI